MKIDINIRDLTPLEAARLATSAAVIAGEHPGTAKPLAASEPPAAPQTAAPPATEETSSPLVEARPSASSAGAGRKPTPTVDPATIANVAAANPAKPPKAEKPAGTGRGRGAKARTAADDADESDITPEEVDAIPETSSVVTPAMRKALKGEVPKAEATSDADEDEDIEFAEEPKAKANGKANGHANGATNGTAKKPAAPAGDFPEQLLNARKLRDILAYLIDEGCTDPKELAAKVADLKEQGLPYLQNIPDLEGRVERTIEIMDVNGG